MRTSVCSWPQPPRGASSPTVVRSVRGGHASWHRVGGFTVLETAIAGTLLVIFLSSLFALNSLAVRLLHSATETASASQELQTRIEQVRLTNWRQICDAETIRTGMMSQPTDAAIDTGALLPGMVEYLIVAPIDTAIFTSTTPSIANVTTTASKPVPPVGGYIIKREKKVSTKYESTSASALPEGEMVQVNITATWPSWGRQRTRSATTMVSRWGISK